MKYCYLGLKLIIGGLVLVVISGCVSTPEPLNTPTPTLAPTPVPPIVTRVPDISTWFRIFGNDKENSGSDLIFTQDGGFLIVGGVGQFHESEPIGGVMLLRTNKDGKLLWERVYGGEGYDSGSAIVETSDGEYLIAGATKSFGSGGSDGYLIKVDADGQLLWSKTYGGNLNEFFSSILPVVGGYLLIGNVEDPNDFITDPGSAGYGGLAGRSNIYILRLDHFGVQKWSKVLESDLNILATDAMLSSTGSILVLATVINFPELENDLILFNFDQNGDQIWMKTWEEGDLSGYAMRQDQDGNILITGLIDSAEQYSSDLFLLMLDPEGNEVWFERYGVQSLYEIGIDVVAMEDGNYAVLTHKSSSLFTNRSSTSIQFVDDSGNFLWESYIELDHFVKSGALYVHPDGGFVIVGGGVGPDGAFNTILIRTNSKGLID